jgi:hypothetical protein
MFVQYMIANRAWPLMLTPISLQRA